MAAAMCGGQGGRAGWAGGVGGGGIVRDASRIYALFRSSLADGHAAPSSPPPPHPLRDTHFFRSPPSPPHPRAQPPILIIASCPLSSFLGIRFRRITYYPDRPDNMAVFDEVRIEADADLYPVLLGNGNKVGGGMVGGGEAGRHYATWSDPYPKPSYLFCIVAGNLGSVSSSYTTRPSGRRVHLEVYSEPENVSKLDHALASLKKSMIWDEDTFGLEYDLDVYNIVAVGDFNMGAMENKVRADSASVCVPPLRCAFLWGWYVVDPFPPAN